MMLLLGSLLAAVAAGIVAGLASLPFLRLRQSVVVLVSVTMLYFPAWLWWLFGLYVGIYPMPALRGMLPTVVPPAILALLCGAWVAARVVREARGRATSSRVYGMRLLQLCGVAILTVLVIGIEGMRRLVDAGHGAFHPLSPYVLLTITCGILLAFVLFVLVRERDPEIALLLLVVAIGAVVPIAGLGRVLGG
jgi:hypothetical protein